MPYYIELMLFYYESGVISHEMLLFFMILIYWCTDVLYTDILIYVLYTDILILVLYTDILICAIDIDILYTDILIY